MINIRFTSLIPKYKRQSSKFNLLISKFTDSFLVISLANHDGRKLSVPFQITRFNNETYGVVPEVIPCRQYQHYRSKPAKDTTHCPEDSENLEFRQQIEINLYTSYLPFSPVSLIFKNKMKSMKRSI